MIREGSLTGRLKTVASEANHKDIKYIQDVSRRVNISEEQFWVKIFLHVSSF